MGLRLLHDGCIDVVEVAAVRIGNDQALIVVERRLARVLTVSGDRRGDLVPRPSVVGRLLYVDESAVAGVVVRDPDRGAVVRDSRPVRLRLVKDGGGTP